MENDVKRKLPITHPESKIFHSLFPSSVVSKVVDIISLLYRGYEALN